MQHVAQTDFSYWCGLHSTETTGMVRFTYTISPGRPAVTWANVAGGFSPAEGPTVDVVAVHVRFPGDAAWRAPTEAETAFLGFIDALSPDDEWLISQAMEDAA